MALNFARNIDHEEWMPRGPQERTRLDPGLLHDLNELFSGRGDDETRRRMYDALSDPNNPVSMLFRRPVKDRPFAEEWPPAELIDRERQ